MTVRVFVAQGQTQQRGPSDLVARLKRQGLRAVDLSVPNGLAVGGGVSLPEARRRELAAQAIAASDVVVVPQSQRTLAPGPRRHAADQALALAQRLGKPVIQLRDGAVGSLLDAVSAAPVVPAVRLDLIDKAIRRVTAAAAVPTPAPAATIPAPRLATGGVPPPHPVPAPTVSAPMVPAPKTVLKPIAAATPPAAAVAAVPVSDALRVLGEEIERKLATEGLAAPTASAAGPVAGPAQKPARRRWWPFGRAASPADA